MIVEYIRYELSTHTPEDLETAYKQAFVHLDAAPQCLSYELAQCVDAPSSFILRIEWQSAEAHMKGFRTGPDFPPFLEAIRPFVPEIKEMRHYEVKRMAPA